MLSDILRLYGVELRDRPQDERRATLERLDLDRTPGVALSPVYTDGPALQAATAQRGLPDVLAKRRDAPYRAGPATAWVRVGNGRPNAAADRTEVCRAASGRAGSDHAGATGQGATAQRAARSEGLS